MDFATQVIKPAWSIIPILEREDIPNAQKLELLTDKIDQPIEALDDLLPEVAPFGFRPLVKLLVDNPLVDGWQRTFIAKPTAEIALQVWTAGERALEGMSEFAKRVVTPLRALIRELASVELTGAQKHARVKSLVRAVLDGVASLTDFLPAGLRDFLGVLRSSQFAADALDLLSGVIAEVVYQVWAFLHPEAGVIATA